MVNSSTKVKAAVVQAASCLFELEASVERARQLIADAATRGSNLILFPEAFIPGYPRGLTFGNQFVTKAAYPKDLEGMEDLTSLPDVLCRGGSAIVSPSGEYLAGPLFDQEGILAADLDLAEVARGKFDLDVAGHYARPDIFQLTINERPAHTIRALNEPNDESP